MQVPVYFSFSVITSHYRVTYNFIHLSLQQQGNIFGTQKGGQKWEYGIIIRIDYIEWDVVGIIIINSFTTIL